MTPYQVRGRLYFSSNHYFMFYRCRYKACATDVAQALALRSRARLLEPYQIKKPNTGLGFFIYKESIACPGLAEACPELIEGE
jgi:hypothetical protein